MATENILALLTGRDSKNPMGFDELLAASGVDAVGLEAELQQMCHWLPAPINSALITRYGKTQMFYWPTGVVEKAERQDITINPKKRPTFPAPRRSEIMSAQPKQETVMQAHEGKSNAKVMLEYLAENNTATGQELCQLAGIESVGSYLGGSIKRGHLLVEKLGQTSRSGNRYTVAPGVTREQLLADGRLKNSFKSGVASAQTESSDKPSEQPNNSSEQPNNPEASTTQPTSNIREFKRPEAPDTVKPVSDTEKQELERFYYCNDVYVDTTGQLVIQQPGRLRMVFPAPDTIRIQKLLLAIDLESLCV